MEERPGTGSCVPGTDRSTRGQSTDTLTQVGRARKQNTPLARTLTVNLLQTRDHPGHPRSCGGDGFALNLGHSGGISGPPQAHARLPILGGHGPRKHCGRPQHGALCVPTTTEGDSEADLTM